ncbi:hypothetical protein [Ramlibacter rhizophilus]|uniref:Uncharacterized protein n=1 Tax=Ramlibacter rhizophilus TaxID=1781167 RepID=A0A4Z0BT78_9BURK|nr:hypothetical protein [Ramlibacter rhizophilus]TFZ01209.1 hypothetical protein EZ242_07435 [Ramlibacter rhizophilus]
MPSLHRLPATALAFLATTASAHEGHGLPGLAHWHPTDAVGLLLVGGLGALAVWYWFGGRK